jgi:hypothetical protein
MLSCHCAHPPLVCWASVHIMSLSLIRCAVHLALSFTTFISITHTDCHALIFSCSRFIVSIIHQIFSLRLATNILPTLSDLENDCTLSHSHSHRRKNTLTHSQQGSCTGSDFSDSGNDSALSHTQTLPGPGSGLSSSYTLSPDTLSTLILTRKT